MRHVALPQLTDKPVPVIGVGGMLLAEPLRSTGELMPWDDAIAVLHHAFDVGITLVDTADIYAPDAAHFGYDERLVGEAVRTWSGGRDKIIVVTKIGITLTVGPDGDDLWGREGSRDYLLRAAEASVARLGFEPDTILLHRLNREQQPFATTVENMLAVRDAGFTPRIGIGNVHLDECEIAWEVSGGAISGVENERSPRYRDDTDVLAWCIDKGVAYFPWSPFGGGDDAARLPVLYPAFADVATEISSATGRTVTAHQVTLAWLLSNGSVVVPIAAVTRAATADSNAAAFDIELSAEQITRLNSSPVGSGSLFPDDED
jgi:aryl-alcohol dehydrogenase-like predicted oxidoreductase